MTEYTHTLSTTAELKKITLQNLQLSIRNAELEKENQVLRYKLSQLIMQAKIIESEKADVYC